MKNNLLAVMKMKRLILIVSALFLVVAVSVTADYPPDYDYFNYFIRNLPPTRVSAGWVGDSAYVTWDKGRDKWGSDADGYRLYRAATEDSMFVLIEKANDLYDVYYDNPTGAKIPVTTWRVAYYTDTKANLEAAGVYAPEPFYYKVTAFVIRPVGGIYGLYTYYNVYESDYSGQVSVVEEIETGFGCFVATAVFGSPLSEEVRILCSFRDGFLIQNRIGRKLVMFYYRVSPRAAEFIRERPMLRSLVRFHLKPVLNLCKFILRVT